jgi:hypothetical protein
MAQHQASLRALCTFSADDRNTRRDIFMDAREVGDAMELSGRHHGGFRLWMGVVLVIGAAAALSFATAASAARSAACGFCGKNLVKNPGAEAGRGQTAPGEVGAVPGWTSTAGQFGAAAYTFGSAWFSVASKGPTDKGKNYFFGGTTTTATHANATIGTQTIKLPSGAAGHKATLSGWLGNYGTNTTEVRAVFVDASGKTLSAIRIGPDTTIGGADMALRTRTGSVPPGAVSVQVIVTFTEHDADYNFAGADDVSLVLT